MQSKGPSQQCVRAAGTPPPRCTTGAAPASSNMRASSPKRSASRRSFASSAAAASSSGYAAAAPVAHCVYARALSDARAVATRAPKAATSPRMRSAWLACGSVQVWVRVCVRHW